MKLYIKGTEKLNSYNWEAFDDTPATPPAGYREATKEEKEQFLEVSAENEGDIEFAEETGNTKTGTDTDGTGFYYKAV